MLNKYLNHIKQVPKTTQHNYKSFEKYIFANVVPPELAVQITARNELHAEIQGPLHGKSELKSNDQGVMNGRQNILFTERREILEMFGKNRWNNCR